MARKKTTTNAKTQTPPDLSFEDALDKVENTIDQIESGQIGLEDSLEAYEKGAALIKHCRNILNRVQQRFEDISGRLDEADGSENQSGGSSQDDTEEAPF